MCVTGAYIFLIPERTLPTGDPDQKKQAAVLDEDLFDVSTTEPTKLNHCYTRRMFLTYREIVNQCTFIDRLDANNNFNVNDAM